MAGKGSLSSPAPSTPPQSSSSSSVCCMCGDRGLPQELFSCKLCRFRSQHRYCSDLYPKTETYRACNWCLRSEEGGKSSPRESSSAENNSNSPSSSSPSSGGGARSVKLLQRAGSASQLNKPIKKQRLPERSVSDVGERGRASPEELSPAGRSRQGFRGKVRRYKLLEEVSS